LKEHIKGPQGEWYEGMPLRNFDVDFQDGKVFDAVICTANPKRIPELKNGFDNKNFAGNLDKAFDILEKDYGVPRLLDVTDMVKGKPDDKSVMCYVALVLEKIDAHEPEPPSIVEQPKAVPKKKVKKKKPEKKAEQAGERFALEPKKRNIETTS